MKRIFFAFLMVVLTFNSQTVKAHPVHVVVSNIVVLNDSVKVEISVGEHELENALNIYFNTKFDLSIDNSAKCPEQVSSYIKNHFILFDGREPLVFNELHVSKIGHKIIISFSKKQHKVLNEIGIENTLLSETHAEIKNMLIVSNGKVEKGLTFDRSDTKKTVTLVE